MGQDRAGSGVDRALKELDRDRNRVITKISSFLAKLERDPISALNLRFTEREGFAADPFEFKGNVLSGDIHLLHSAVQDPAGEWAPPKHQEGAVTIEPLRLMLSPWGTTVALRVSHEEPGFRLKLNWFKKSDPAAGPVYLVDPVNHQYLYLTASSLKGEVLPGVPLTGILVFQRIRYPTDRLQIQFSDVSIGKGRDHRSSFCLECTDKDLPGMIDRLGALPTMSESLETMLDSEVDKIRSGFLKLNSGCSGAVVSLLAIVGAVVLFGGSLLLAL